MKTAEALPVSKIIEEVLLTTCAVFETDWHYVVNLKNKNRSSASQEVRQCKRFCAYIMYRHLPIGVIQDTLKIAESTAREYINDGKKLAYEQTTFVALRRLLQQKLTVSEYLKRA